MTGSGFDQGTPFLLASPEETLVARGVARVIDGSRQGLAGRVAAHLASRQVDGDAPAVVGALPFDPAAPAHLYEPRVAVLTRGTSTWIPQRAVREVAPRIRRARPHPSRDEFAQAVSAALSRMEDGPAADRLRKVVLARALRVESPSALEPLEIFRRLRTDHSVSAYHVPLPPTSAGWRTLVGASPELLVKREGVVVTSTPLAGSTRRHADPRLDREAAGALLASDKDQREHALVVEWIADRLEPYCTTLSVPSRPVLTSTSSMWHLSTRIRGELRGSGPSSLELALALHPTPAVCGVPAALAFDTIRDLEPFDRGFFTGAVGWCAPNGDGQWLVAIRCAEVSEHAACVFAGAGIVPGSDPDAEVEETAAKFTALLQALNVEEAGEPLHQACG